MEIVSVATSAPRCIIRNKQIMATKIAAVQPKDRPSLASLMGLDEGVRLLDTLLDDIEDRRAVAQLAATERAKIVRDSGGEPEPWDPDPWLAEEKAAIEAALAGMGEAVLLKLDSYVEYLQALEAAATVRRGRAVALTALARTGENRVERLKERILFWLDEHNKKDIETPDHKLWWQHNSAPGALVYKDPANPTVDLPATVVAVTTTISYPGMLDEATFARWVAAGATISTERRPIESLVRPLAERRAELLAAAVDRDLAGEIELAEAYLAEASGFPEVSIAPRGRHLRIR
jgi:hypothetical protein